MRHLITVSEEYEGLAPRGFTRLIRRAMRAALRSEKILPACSVSVLITDDEGIHRINREFRDVDRATDVLSFPMNNLKPTVFDIAACEINPEDGRVLLGDMAVSVEHIFAQSVEYGHSVQRELSYLTVHSCLHLLGYDHMDEGEDKKLMREHEDMAMKLMKL